MCNTESEYQELTFDKLFVYYAAKDVTLNKSNFKKNLGLMTENGKYNLLAQLISDDSHIPIRFAIFNGTDKASTMYSVRKFGHTCLLFSLDKVLEYGEVLNIPQADERGRKVERKEVMLFNEEAFREAIINAFVHNQWTTGNAPMITEIYGKQTYEFRENSIVVSIPFTRVHEGGMTPDEEKMTPDEEKMTPVEGKMTLDGEKMTLVEGKKRSSNETKILEFCIIPRSTLKIAEMLGLKEKKSARRHIQPLVEQGRLAMTLPDRPNSKNQKYITIR